MDLNVSIGAALLAGALSFLSPCVLPLVPPYLCYISGRSLEELTESDQSGSALLRGQVMLAALIFVLGFTTAFVLLGAGASYAGQFLRSHWPLLTTIAGIGIMIMGLNFLGLFRIGFLSRETRYHYQGKAMGVVGAYFIGLAFAFGWTPCIGPVLAAILAVASNAESVNKGMGLLAVYSLGLGIPFLLAAFSLDAFLSFFRRFRKHMPTIEKAMGVLLVLTGFAFMSGWMQALSNWLQDLFPALVKLG